MDETPDPIQHLSAITLVTADMAAAVTFYEDLGFRRLYGGPTAPFTSFRVGDGFLNLQHSAPAPHGLWGRAIFWVDDVDAMHRRAEAAGYSPTSEPADAPWGERYFHLHDPDGHELSFARPIAP